MRQSRSSGSAEGVMGNHDPYSDVRHVHGAIVDNLNFIEVKICVTAEVFFDDLVKVFFIDFDLALYEALVLVIFHRINITHLDSPPTFLASLLN
jgi:hypothetical protein